MIRSRGLGAFVVLAVFSWLLPLGAFIKPGQETTACNGKRAFHMCSMMTGKVHESSSDKPGFHAAGDFAKAKTASSGDDLALIAAPDELFRKTGAFTPNENTPFYSYFPYAGARPPEFFSPIF